MGKIVKKVASIANKLDPYGRDAFICARGRGGEFRVSRSVSTDLGATFPQYRRTPDGLADGYPADEVSPLGGGCDDWLSWAENPPQPDESVDWAGPG